MAMIVFVKIDISARMIDCAVLRTNLEDFMGEQVIKRSATEQVYTLIVKKIRKGEFAPGDRLKIESLAKEFGVSRTPVREAIGMLTQDGFLEQVYNSGPRIPTFSKKRVHDLIETNGILTDGIIPLIFQTRDLEVLAADLQKSVDRQRQALQDRDNESFMHNSIRYHEKIIAASPNKSLAQLAEQVQKQLDAWVSFYQEAEGSRERSVNQHQEIIDAFRDRDQEEVMQLLKEHNFTPMEYFEKS